MISCACIYEVNGLDRETLEETHPEVYSNGPTDKMIAKFDAEWGVRRMPWLEEWPGYQECCEYGFFCRQNPYSKLPNWQPNREHGPYWIPCDADEPEAMTYQSQLIVDCDWNQELQRFVLVRPGTYLKWLKETCGAWPESCEPEEGADDELDNRN
jgi:hypothetical protein